MYDNMEKFLKNVKEKKEDTLNINFDHHTSIYCKYNPFTEEIIVYDFYFQTELVMIETRFCDIEMIEQIIRTIKGYYE